MVFEGKATTTNKKTTQKRQGYVRVGTFNKQYVRFACVHHVWCACACSVGGLVGGHNCAWLDLVRFGSVHPRAPRWCCRLTLLWDSTLSYLRNTLSWYMTHADTPMIGCPATASPPLPRAQPPPFTPTTHLSRAFSNVFCLPRKKKCQVLMSKSRTTYSIVSRTHRHCCVKKQNLIPFPALYSSTMSTIVLLFLITVHYHGGA